MNEFDHHILALLTEQQERPEKFRIQTMISAHIRL